MAFRASKKRAPRPRQAIAEGKQLIANASIRDEYEAGLKIMINKMVADYRRELLRGFNHEDVEDFYTEDASVTVIFKRMLARLDKKWRDKFADFAKDHARRFTEKVDKYSAFTSIHSLKQLGLDKPKDVNTEKMVETIRAATLESANLITNIQADFAKDIAGNVFRSIASPVPSENGSDKVLALLMERGDMTKRRASLIAEDQNSKLYSALNAERMNQNGIKLFRWKHSSAGKYPRESHIAREKENVGYGPGIFRFDSPELWEGPKNDQGLPGHAIRCRCRMIPVVDLSAD